MDEDNLLNGLLDFSDLRRKQDESFFPFTKRSQSPERMDLQKLMRSFREIREKLRVSTADNQQLREELRGWQVQVRQLQESQNNLGTINQQLKEKNGLLQVGNDELRKKVGAMKEVVKQNERLREEVGYLKEGLVGLKMEKERAEEERKKLVEISIEDKMELEEQLARIHSKSEGDLKYTKQIEVQLRRTKEKMMRMQTDLKKTQIKYDEQVFNKQWSKNNFVQQHHQQTIKQLQNQVTELKGRIKKDKQRRGQLEARVIELEEATGMWNVKAEVLEGEAEVMDKKMKRMQRSVTKLKSSASKMAEQRISWEEKFTRCVIISEELIARVKRELLGDIVELARSCQFKINKLKENREENMRTTVMSASKTKDKKHRKSVEKQFRTTFKKQGLARRLQFQEQPKDHVLTESKAGNNILIQFKPKNDFSSDKSCLQGKENTVIFPAKDDVELKIRREREEMEKKLRERMMYRQVQLSGPSDKSRLRQDYLRMVLQ